MMSMLPVPQQKAPERASTATNSQEEELQQIEADLQEEKLHCLRNRLDAMLGSLVEQPSSAPALNEAPSDSNSTVTTRTSVPQKPPPEDQVLLPDRIWVTDPYGDQGQYQGETDADGIPHGIGNMLYLDGRTYQGGWRHGHWHGPAKATFQNGDFFEGNYHMDQRHGPGRYQWKDGRSYAGDFYRDQRNGRGEFRWPDGSCYVGEFRNGHRHGYGNYRFPDGSVYEGTWKGSRMHGQGECKWSDRRVYTGEWKDGKAHGLGKETRPDGSVRHDGLWEEDRPIRDPPTADGTTGPIADRHRRATSDDDGSLLMPPPTPPRAESLGRVDTEDVLFLEAAAGVVIGNDDEDDDRAATADDGRAFGVTHDGVVGV